jgi:propanol-preferring alcohol dehydrogenase
MRAARLHAGASSLVLEEVATPEPNGDEVLVRVAGAGVCRSDLHVLDGLFAELVRPPVTMGHEIAGRVEAVGPDVRGLAPGDGVAVMVGWGCGRCRWCTAGHEQLCPQGDEAGATRDGGFADFVLVPRSRHLVPLGDLDPVEATPLGCAALSAYAAVTRVRPQLADGSTLAVIGIGGLGEYAVQIARAIGEATVVAVDVDDDRLALAQRLGAHHGVRAGAGAAGEIRALTGGEGADAVIDLVGSDETLALGADAVARRGVVALLGLAGGSVEFDFFRLAPEASLTTVVAGTLGDLREVVALAQAGRIRSRVRRYPLGEIGRALDDLRHGRVDGRAVVVP